MRACITHQTQLRPAATRKTTVTRTPDVIEADVAGFQARGIYQAGRPWSTATFGLRLLPNAMLQCLKLGQAQQAMTGVTQNGIIRNALQSERRPQVTEVPQVLADSAVV